MAAHMHEIVKTKYNFISGRRFCDGFVVSTCPSFTVFQWQLSVEMSAKSFLFVAGLCLMCTIGRSATSTVGNKSVLPYLLRGDRKDICLDQHTLQGKGECLQALLENYYGTFFTIDCPFLPLILADTKCKGCPWDRVNASMINPVIASELDHSELFHPASRSCSIANHVEKYTYYSYVWRSVFGYGILGMWILSLVSAYYSVSSSSVIELANDANIFGFQMPEPLFLLALWLLYHGGSFLLSVSADYIEFCTGVADYMLQESARLLFYAIFVMISLKRCRAVRFVSNDEEIQSWGRYFDRKRRRRLLWNFLLGPSVIVFFFGELLAQRSAAEKLFYDKSICYAGAKSWPYFSLQLAKIVLEMFVVAIYACGPSTKFNWFYFRYSMLLLSFSVSIALFALVCKGYDAFEITFMMIPRVADAKIALPLTNLVHVMCVSLMGLLEPIRIKWPRRNKNERKA